MLSHRACGLVVLLVAVAVTTSSGVAFADDGIGRVDCAQKPSTPGCELTAEVPGVAGGTSDGSGDGSGGASGNGDSGCYWAPVPDDRPPPAGKRPQGGWYARTCTSGGIGSQGMPQWLDQPPGVDVGALALAARSRLRLPAPGIHTNPEGTPFVLVRVPVWLWVDPVSWGARSASVSVPGVVVTATATPARVRWSFSDGTREVTCAGPGKPWTPGTDPRAASPCGHTYQRSSAAAPGAVFLLRATVTWSVVWSGPQGGGTLAPLTTTASAPMRVAQSQAIVGNAR
ncbi:hypothetical protein KSK32_11115 [Micromonospora sp. WMMB482]|uniref:hypothetical protein n=1 Tax=Micromonospora sp. WMMB482 TaxID=2849653 RepID=UPI001C2302A2|nr:hypothetical protein [Micromonospora sp. WMMB482]MBU8857783.1 hypothetical protein [Micromonospora sp. WMMB482]